MTDSIMIILAAFIGSAVGGLCSYQYGYYIGYKAGMAYGMSKLEEYHQYTLNNIRNVHSVQARKPDA